MGGRAGTPRAWDFANEQYVCVFSTERTISKKEIKYIRNFYQYAVRVPLLISCLFPITACALVLLPTYCCCFPHSDSSRGRGRGRLFIPQNGLSSLDPMRLSITWPPLQLKRSGIQMPLDVLQTHPCRHTPHQCKVKHICCFCCHVVRFLGLAQFLRFLHQLMSQ